MGIPSGDTWNVTIKRKANNGDKSMVMHACVSKKLEVFAHMCRQELEEIRKDKNGAQT